MNGFLQLRASAGPQLQARLLQLRVAHIPAGSTDAVACTLHGTRSVFTAAMHIALGDRYATAERVRGLESAALMAAANPHLPSELHLGLS